MTEQEIFNAAVRGLASQGFERCVAENGNCVYNGPDGRHCALGWVVPEEDRHLLIEGTSPYHLSVGLISTVRGNDDISLNFLASLQQAHDKAANAEKVKQNLRNFGREHDLELPEELA